MTRVVRLVPVAYLIIFQLLIHYLSLKSYLSLKIYRHLFYFSCTEDVIVVGVVIKRLLCSQDWAIPLRAAQSANKNMGSLASQYDLVESFVQWYLEPHKTRVPMFYEMPQISRIPVAKCCTQAQYVHSFLYRRLRQKLIIFTASVDYKFKKRSYEIAEVENSYMEIYRFCYFIRTLLLFMTKMK